MRVTWPCDVASGRPSSKPCASARSRCTASRSSSSTTTRSGPGSTSAKPRDPCRARRPGPRSRARGFNVGARPRGEADHRHRPDRPDSADEGAYVPALEAAGYELTIREPDWYEHRRSRAPTPGQPARLLGRLSGDRADGRVRDRLRTNPADRELYERAKRDLAQRTWTVHRGLRRREDDVVEEIVARAEFVSPRRHGRRRVLTPRCRFSTMDPSMIRLGVTLVLSATLAILGRVWRQETSAEEEWAGDVCMAVSGWRDQVQPSTDEVREALQSPGPGRSPRSTPRCRRSSTRPKSSGTTCGSSSLPTPRPVSRRSRSSARSPPNSNRPQRNAKRPSTTCPRTPASPILPTRSDRWSPRFSPSSPRFEHLHCGQRERVRARRGIRRC